MNVNLYHRDIHCTLTTYIYCHYWMAWCARQQGHNFYIDWPKQFSVVDYFDEQKFRENPNQYEWYFKQPDLQVKGNDANWMWGEMDFGQFFSHPLADCKNFYKATLIFNDAVNERGRQLQEKYEIDFSKTIGITWRGTDIELDKRPYLPIEVYFPFIDDILEKEPELRIICTAEETEILNPLLKRYDRSTIIEEFEQAPKGSKSNPERNSVRSGFERGLQPVLMVWLFSKCAHYIKNRSSTGMVSSFISDGNIVTLGCDEKLTTWDAENKRPFMPIAEINGVQYPLYR